MDKSDLYKIHQEWIEKSLTSSRLTEWEGTFLSSIKKQLESKGSLSHKQIEILERIYGERTN